jgi:hypothetical protein
MFGEMGCACLYPFFWHLCTSSGLEVTRKHPHLKETTPDFAGSNPPVVLVEMVRSPGWWCQATPLKNMSESQLG